MTLPFAKNHRPPAYYGVRLPQPAATWDSHTMWRCTRHIPSSKVYPAFVEKCPSCHQPRPPEDRRPADPYAAPVKVVTAFLATEGVVNDYLRDPEWVQGVAVVETPAPAPSDRCSRCGDDPLLSTVCVADFLELPPAKVTEESLENMRTLRDVNAELDFAKDMSLGQAQRDLDAMVVGDLANATTDVVRVIHDEGVAKIQDEVGREMLAELRESDAPSKAKKPVCPGPGCQKGARESSPYCSKICSDRCGRVRRKGASGAVLTKSDSANLTRITKALENWGKR